MLMYLAVNLIIQTFMMVCIIRFIALTSYELFWTQIDINQQMINLHLTTYETFESKELR